MKLRHLTVKNFRGIEEVDVDFDRDLSVIVGQNAIGKTTLLEAIRLAKSVLSPRFYGEAAGVMQQLAISSPHHQFFGIKGLDARAVSSDTSTPTEILLSITLSADEISTLNTEGEQFSRLLLQSQLGNDFESNIERLAIFLSDQAGQLQLATALKEVETYLSSLTTNSRLQLNLRIDGKASLFRGVNRLDQLSVSLLERALSPAKAKFSYYQADRAFPQGEVQVQLGSQDAQQQIQSHWSAPALKYQRLKVSIVAGLIMGNLKQEDFASAFASVFDDFLPGKSFSKVEVSQIGILRVLVKDKASGKEFDIDALSSGEKGLVLTFLSLYQSLAKGAIVLLDEPELHLNPGVTRNIIPVILSKVCKLQEAQVILTTHSAEILSDAFESEDCRLYTLRGPKSLSPVYPEDNAIVLDMLAELGVSTADVLFNKGAIFVEGPHDIEILTEGWGDIISSYKVTHLGGRQEVEKAIGTLSAKGSALKGKRSLFILDGDRKKTTLKSAGEVAVLQWSKYCLENYLIDDRALFNIVSQLASSDVTVGDRAEFMIAVREIAFSQIDTLAVTNAYEVVEPDNTGIRPSEVRGKSVAEAVDILWNRIDSVKVQVCDLEKAAWIDSLLAQAKINKEAIEAEWSGDEWKNLANGKILFEDVLRKFKVNVDRLSVKRKVVKEMKELNTENWKLIRALLIAELA